MSNYARDFIEAIDRTKKLNLKLEEFEIDSSFRCFSEKTHNDLKNLLILQFPEFIRGGLAHKCATVSYFMKPFVEQYLNTSVILTCGYFSFDTGPFYFFDENLAKELLVIKQQDDIIRFHAWLTLPNMEIIDFTIGNTFAKVRENFPLNEYLFNHPINFRNSLSYHPIVLGEDFLIQTGYLKFHSEN